MTKIGEPSMLTSKKRSWTSTTLHGRAPLFQKQDNHHHHTMMAGTSTSNGQQQIKKKKQQQQRYHPNRPPPKHQPRCEEPEFLSKCNKALFDKGQMKPPPPALLPALQQHSNQQPAQPKPKKAADADDMQSILLRYHSLALAHASAAKHISKRRKLDSSQSAARRSAYHTQHAKRLEHLTALKKMAAETLEFTEEVIRGEEERFRREMEVELEDEQSGANGSGGAAGDWDEMNRRALKEREVAEGLLKKYGIAPVNVPEDDKEDNSMDEDNNNGSDEGYLIGGIPSKFLDLTHFPGLQRQQREFARKNQLKKRASQDSGDKKKKDGDGRHIIDCTEEAIHQAASAVASSPQRLLASYPTSAFRSPARIPSFGPNCNNNNNGSASENSSVNSIPQEIVAPSPGLAPKKMGKQNTKRIFISHASLPHVNGTYVQEGSYNGAPLFVRAGPPRKFMGKWDCDVVLRRERKCAQDVVDRKKFSTKGSKKKSNGKGSKKAVATVPEEKGEYVWKIGLVPAHRITHPRIIGYFVAEEDAMVTTNTNTTPPSTHHHHVPKRVSNMDRMDEDMMDDEDDYGFGNMASYVEPPVDGWKVFQENNNSGNVNAGNTLGRSTGLKVSYVE